jgi:membrane-associated protease RseP (regulator of RpoE activity)
MLQILIISLKSHTEFTPLLPALLQAMFAALPAGALALFLRKLKTKKIKRISEALPTTGNVFLDVAIVASLISLLCTGIALTIQFAFLTVTTSAALLSTLYILGLVTYVIGLVTSYIAVFDLKKRPLKDARDHKLMSSIAVFLAILLSSFFLISFLLILLFIGMLALILGLFN